MSAEIPSSAVGDVLRDFFQRQTTRGLAFLPSADTVGNHHEGRDAFFFQRQSMIIGQTRQPDVETSAQRADEKVILILGAKLSWMGEPVDIDLIVARST